MSQQATTERTGGYGAAEGTLPRGVATHRWWAGKRFGEVLGRVMVMSVLAIGAILVMIPFVWTITTSLKTTQEIMAWPPTWIPETVTLDNYHKALTTIPFMGLLQNTLVITAFRLIGMVSSSSLVAYGFARLRAPGRDVLFLMVLATMMLPAQVTLIPTFVLFSKLGWVNTFLPLIVPSFFGGSFNIFLLRQFFMTIPLEYDDAARIDGCSVLGTFFRIILPLSAPALATVAIFGFMWSWNDFMGPLIYLNRIEKYTLSIGLRLFQTRLTIDYAALMAATIMSMIPILAVFFVAQRYFIQGIVISGVKG
jgi:multiple sugar transport system permease protein